MWNASVIAKDLNWIGWDGFELAICILIIIGYTTNVVCLHMGVNVFVYILESN